MTGDRKWIPDVTIIGARLLWRNFSANETPYKKAGEARTFHVILPEDVAMAMREDGWNVKDMPPRTEEDEPRWRVEVEARFEPRPPHMTLVTHKGRTKLTEDMLPILDWAEFEQVDLIITPYKWDNKRGASGVKAYLKTGFFTLREDPLELMYADVPDAQGGVESLKGQMDDDVAPF